MTDPITSDTARLPVMLTQLRLPTVARLWPTISETADREGWPAARTLAALLEHEITERAQRRIARHLLEARLPSGKTLDGFDLAAVSSLSKARLVALAEGDAWLAQGTKSCCSAHPESASRIPRPRADRCWLPRAVHAHHRPRPAAADVTTGTQARGNH